MPDTIAAIATAPGEAGIGIVRLSGPDALRLSLELFRRPPTAAGAAPARVDAATVSSHHARYGWLVRPGEEGRLDDCVLIFFQSPRSYTGEEVVELSCHGSNLVLGLVLRALVGLGARLAEPGEFTQRAFLNGRLDLAEAEAVIEVIRARTDAALRVANGQLGGRLSSEVSALRHDLITLLAEIEAGIDFPEEIDPPADTDVARRAAATRSRAERMLRTADAGRLYREGAALVLAGRPNVGKSSLLNALLREERAIVTEVPGTTRDVIEESLNLRGVPVRAIDTAGVRDTADRVEALGVERTRTQMGAADLIVWVLDASEGLTSADRELLPELRGRRVVVAANKQDLGYALDPGELHSLLGREVPVVPVTAQSGEGIPTLEQVLADALLGEAVTPESVYVSSARHAERLTHAISALNRATEAAEAGFDQAAVALDLRLAAEALGEITGETVTEETISQIFARFCVGK